jgi:hypothetical protein
MHRSLIHSLLELQLMTGSFYFIQSLFAIQSSRERGISRPCPCA